MYTILDFETPIRDRQVRKLVEWIRKKTNISEFFRKPLNGKTKHRTINPIRDKQKQLANEKTKFYS